MKKIEVYVIPVGCCAPVSSPEEAAFKETFVKLKQEDVEIEIVSLPEQPQRFLSNPVINEIIQKEGKEAFPVTLINGDLFIKGRYPQFEELN
ncbi:MAG: arsenic metallochaperone ArsD family protein [Syntrophomonas sp.]